MQILFFQKNLGWLKKYEWLVYSPILDNSDNFRSNSEINPKLAT